MINPTDLDLTTLSDEELEAIVCAVKLEQLCRVGQAKPTVQPTPVPTPRIETEEDKLERDRAIVAKGHWQEGMSQKELEDYIQAGLRVRFHEDFKAARTAPIVKSRAELDEDNRRESAQQLKEILRKAHEDMMRMGAG
jgi:hypothetical protein